MKVLVTGGAGFIGSRLCHFLVREGHAVTAYDNLTLGRREFLAGLDGRPGFRFFERDLTADPELTSLLAGQDLIFHLAANSDISQSGQSTDIDLKHGTLATYNVLEAARRGGVKKLAFASTSAVDGEAAHKPTPETYGPLLPISLYGASKLACEGLISAFVHNFGLQAWVFRFANIVGPNLTHGAIFDFVAHLRRDPERLTVLGDGTQKKSYLHVDDCISGMLFALERSREDLNLFNLASEGVTEVRAIAEEVVRRMGGRARIEYGSSDRGWRGDVPFTWLDGAKIGALGWKARLTSNEAVRAAVGEAVSGAI